MKSRIILAGFGGQGIIVGGKLLACAAMKEGKEVTHYPSYGAEMRGGTCNCAVIISDQPISSPIIGESDIVAVLNQPSKNKFEKNVVKNGIILMNSSLISGLSGEGLGFRWPVFHTKPRRRAMRDYSQWGTIRGVCRR